MNERKKEVKILKVVNWLAAEVRVLRNMVDKLGQGGARATTLSATAGGLVTAEGDKTGSGYQQYIDYQMYMQGGQGCARDYVQNMDYLKYMQGGQGGQVGAGDYMQYLDG